MNRSRKQYIKSCEVSELCTFNLAGYEQKVLIEGKSRNLPVVICLHGGPGSPVPFSVGCRGLFPEWTDKAVMVYWDQLGCGINNFKIDDSFGIDSFVQMTVELVKQIKARFPQNRLYLFGVSWGSILSLKASLLVPELLNGAFVYGQFLINNFFSEEVAAAFLSAPAKVRQAVIKIKETGGDCEYKVLNKNLQTLFKYLTKYTDAYYNKNSEPIKIGAIIKGLLTSPDYSLKDFKAVINNGYKHNQSLWRELIKINLAQDIASLKIPYLIFQGDSDIVTSTRVVTAAAQSCGNGIVRVKTVENSGHMPSAAAMEEIFHALIEFIQC